MRKAGKMTARSMEMLAVILFLVFLLCRPVKAETDSAGKAEGYDASRTGSITVELTDIKTKREGAAFRCYQVAEMEEGSEVFWRLLPSFKDTGVDVNSLNKAADYREAAKKLAAAKGKSNASHTDGRTDKKGIVSFTNLNQGIYFIEQTETGDYGAVPPFLITIPCVENGNSWVYDVHTSTKSERLPEDTEPGTEKPSTHKPGTGTEKPSKNTPGSGTEKILRNSVKTSDNTVIGTYGILMLLAGLVLLAGFAEYRRGQHRGL